jgi:hypothetical protein
VLREPGAAAERGAQLAAAPVEPRGAPRAVVGLVRGEPGERVAQRDLHPAAGATRAAATAPRVLRAADGRPRTEPRQQGCARQVLQRRGERRVGGIVARPVVRRELGGRRLLERRLGEFVGDLLRLRIRGRRVLEAGLLHGPLADLEDVLVGHRDLLPRDRRQHEEDEQVRGERHDEPRRVLHPLVEALAEVVAVRLAARARCGQTGTVEGRVHGWLLASETR